MSLLSQIKKGEQNLPYRVILAGPEGIGKSTFAASSPAPIFVCAENGLVGLPSVDRFEPESFPKLIEFLRELVGTAGKSPFKSIVIDTVDWLEALIHQHICDRDKKANISAYDFGQGYIVAELELATMLSLLEALWKKGMHIILLSHVEIKTHSTPGQPTHDRFSLKGHKKFSGKIKEWVDAILFATYDIFVTKDGKSERLVDGGRLIHTVWHPGWDAKNRFNLPATIELNWHSFDEEAKAGLAALAAQQKRIAELCALFRKLVPQCKFEGEVAEKVARMVPETMPLEKLEEAVAKLEAKLKK